ncbi:MAG: hypothetical protein KAJ18_03820 [Candidatus Omnitrophica bacterium]|nr:hypothetical protein [Candidatus Omnitrophota bacterium]
MFKQLAKSREAFTMTEVVVAAIVFTLASSGIIATVTSLNKPAAESTEYVTAAFLGKKILEGLRKEVDGETWNEGALVPCDSSNPYTMQEIIIDDVYYTPIYIVEADPNGTSARKVTLNMLWGNCSVDADCPPPLICNGIQCQLQTQIQASLCGDASCDATEDCLSCPADCGPCPPVCGDGSCDFIEGYPPEDCSSCPADCGPCT